MKKMKKIRSRIHQFITPELMAELDKVCNNVIVSDNNLKAMKIKHLLDKHGVYYNELGPGTNRMAVLIDGYVFKFAMDKWGKQDNANEFAMSKELQPYVIKVYECNDLISVSEYVTLITREEFREKRFPILKILSTLSESYLIGDVGYVEKNFANWGYRDNNELVILDFAYIHNIEGTELFCQKDGQMIEYDSNFYKLKCPACHTVYSFIEIRKKISIEEEWDFINKVKNHSYILDSSEMLIKDETEQNNNVDKTKEEKPMKEEMQEFEQDIIEESYASALARLRAKNVKVNTDDECEDDPVVVIAPEPEPVEEEEEEEGADFYQMMKQANPNANLTAPYERDEEEEVDSNEDEHEGPELGQVTFDIGETDPDELMALVDEVVSNSPNNEDAIPRNTKQLTTDLTGTNTVVRTESHTVRVETTKEVTTTQTTPVTNNVVDAEPVEEAKEDEQVTTALPNPDTTQPASASRTFNPAELMARAHQQNVKNRGGNKIRISRPTPQQETEEEKYERLAREHGHDVD